jgi:hypothetical protein
MRSCKLALSALMIYLLASPTSRGALIIDTLDSGLGGTLTPGGGDGVLSNVAYPISEAIGGFRAVGVTRPIGNGTVALNIGGGQLSFSVDPNTEGTGGILWNANDGINGLGPIDLTQNGANHGFLFSMTTGAKKLEMRVQSGNSFPTAVVIQNPVGPLVFLPFSSFPAATDFVHVKQLNFILTVANGGMATVDFIQTVPEPATQVMVLAICVCLRATRQRQAGSRLIP